ncbi:MAG: FkbM family methyltransferase [Candidatus Aenigmatarchaeota archaeon]
MEEKNKILLEKLDSIIGIREFMYANSIRRGIFNKIKRFILIPEFPLTYLFYKLGLIKSIDRKLFFGRRIKMQIKDLESCLFGNFQIFLELNLVKFFIKNLKSSDIFYDIGANYGSYTYLALEICKEVHAFEPINYMYEAIKNNATNEINNKKLFLNCVALSNKNGIENFYLCKDYSGCSSLILNPKNADTIKVSTITLNEYLKNHNPPSIIKMDVEGAEKLVIEGGLNFFKKNSPIITMEVWSKDNNGEISMKAVELLRSIGYQSYYIDISGEIHKINGDLSEFVMKNENISDNFVFKKE